MPGLPFLNPEDGTMVAPGGALLSLVLPQTSAGGTRGKCAAPAACPGFRRLHPGLPLGHPADSGGHAHPTEVTACIRSGTPRLPFLNPEDGPMVAPGGAPLWLPLPQT